MYNTVVAKFRTCNGLTCDFSITIRIYQGHVLNRCLFAIVMDRFTKAIKNKISLCILFDDDMVLVDDIRVWVNLDANTTIWRF